MINIPKPTKDTGSVQTNYSLALLTLASNTGLVNAGPTMTRGGRMLSLKMQVAWHSITPTDSPIALWLVNADLSLAEFEAYLETSGPVFPDDTTPAEIATRGKKVRYLGILVPQGDGSVAGFDIVDRKMSGFQWSEEAAGWQLVAYNLGTALSTGSVLRVLQQTFVEWTPGG